MAQKKIPSRQCIGCMTSRPKKELVRVVRAPSGEISIDLVGKKPGRGAYLCPNPDCLTKAKKKKALERCFEQPAAAGGSAVSGAEPVPQGGRTDHGL